MKIGKTKALSDRVIALDLLAGSISASNAVCNASLVAANPDLKRLFKDFLQDTVMGAEALETYAYDQRWIDPFASSDDQLRVALQHADEFVAQRV